MNVFLPANVSNRLPGLLKLFVVLWALMIQSVSANSQYSGSWYNSDRDGEGFHIEMLEDDQVLVIWFTYPGPTDDPSAEQAWILGSGTITDNTITIIGANKFQGPEFGPDYNKDDLVLLPWGDLSIVFSGNNNATVEYDGLDGEGTTDVIRITSMAERENATRIPVGFSGAWYNPATNGQGWFVEVLSDESALVYFFTYDANGNQAWNLAVGYLDGNRIVVPNSQTGKGTFFGTQFDTKDVVRESFVDVVLEYEDCKSGMAKYKTTDGEHSGSMPIERITTLDGKECKVLVLNTGEAGYIMSDSGEQDCLEGQTCLTNLVSDGSSVEALTAVPRSGYVFSGWTKTSGELCTDDEASCVPDTSGVESDVVLAPVFEPEGSIYFPPDEQLLVCQYTEPNLTQSVTCTLKNFSDYGYGPLSDFKLTTDQFFIDYRQRKQELAQLPEELRNNLCSTTAYEAGFYTEYTPTPPLDPLQDYNPPPPGVHGPLLLARVHYTLLDNQDAAGLIKRSLLEWAENEVDLIFAEDVAAPGWGAEVHYQLGLLMPIYVMAWEAIRDLDFVSPTDRSKIDDYLYKLMRFLALRLEREAGNFYDDPYVCPDNCGWGNNEVFNHSWTQDLGLMVFAVWTGNDTLFQRGIKRYFAILDGLIRPDGSHFSESQRGGSALSYSIGATDTLIRMAELAAVQGYDLYGVEIDGKSLHTIMDFHISAIEDETLIHPYAQSVQVNPWYCENDSCRNSWNNQLFSEDNPGGWDGAGGWIEFDVYRKRFPESPLVPRYLALFPNADQFYYWEGTFVQACEFRDVSRLID